MRSCLHLALDWQRQGRTLTSVLALILQRHRFNIDGNCDMEKRALSQCASAAVSLNLPPLEASQEAVPGHLMLRKQESFRHAYRPAVSADVKERSELHIDIFFCAGTKNKGKTHHQLPSAETITISEEMTA